MTNANWFFSPYSTWSDGAGALGANNIHASSTEAVWILGGAYFKCIFTGTSATLNIRPPTVSTGTLKWSVDTAPWQTYTTGTSDTTIGLASSLSAGNHTLIAFWTPSQVLTTQNRYTPTFPVPPGDFVITGLVLDTAATLNTLSGSVALGTKNVIYYGDSIDEGYATTGASTNDAQLDYIFDLSRALNAEYGAIAVSGQSWLSQALFGDFPSLPGSWDSYYTGKSRLISSKLSPMPDAVFVNMGTNDGTSNIQSTVVTWLASIRAAVNTTTPVIIVIPFGQYESANLSAAIATAADPYVYKIDLGASAAYGLNNTGNTASWVSYDGLHPNTYEHGVLATLIVGMIQNGCCGGILIGPGVRISGNLIMQ